VNTRACVCRRAHADARAVAAREKRELCVNARGVSSASVFTSHLTPAFISRGLIRMDSYEGTHAQKSGGRGTGGGALGWCVPASVIGVETVNLRGCELKCRICKKLRNTRRTCVCACVYISARVHVRNCPHTLFTCKVIEAAAADDDDDVAALSVVNVFTHVCVGVLSACASLTPLWNGYRCTCTRAHVLTYNTG